MEVMNSENQTQSATDFAATDSEGRLLRLSDYRGKKNVVLVFNRGFF
jgi:peroxiredoxin